MSAPDTEVLIIGAGPVGLTLACLLAKHRVPHRIVDQNAGPVEESRATDLHARSLELFATLGLAEAIAARGSRSQAVKFYSGRRVIAAVETADLDTPYPFILGIPQYDTEKILIADLEARGGQVERGLRLEGFGQTDAGVRATLIDARGARLQTTARWLVGCDGASSTVRQLLGLPFAGLTYEEDFMLADASLRWDQPRDELAIFFSERGFCNVLPMPGDNRVRLFIDVPAGQEALAPTAADFARVLAERVPFAAELYDPGWMARFRVHRRMVPRYKVGRVFLAGDAAHIHSPVGGQGMNMGVQDSFNLGWKLALVSRGKASEALLESYHIERHAVAAETLLKTDLATRMSMIRYQVLAEVRDRFSPLFMRLPGMKQWLAQATSALAVHMRKSPIVAADRRSILRSEVLHNPRNEEASVAEWVEFGFGPEPGERAPDREFGLPEERRRFSTLMDGQRFHLLLFDGAVGTPEGYENLLAIANAARARFAEDLAVHLAVPYPAMPERLASEPAVLLDPGGDLHCSFGGRAECLYLIRPDGYIGYRSQPALQDKLFQYLDGLLAPRA